MQDARNKFLRKFVKEQKAMTEKIVGDFKADKANQDLIDERRDKFGEKRLSTSKIMAFIYQTRETEIMEQLDEGIKEELKANPVILRVHDGFYSSKRIPMALIQGILDKIQYDNCKDFRRFITASEEPINP